VKLYIDANGQYVATQEEAKRAGKGWRKEEVPVKQADLISYLNTKFGGAPVSEEPEFDEIQEDVIPLPPPILKLATAESITAKVSAFKANEIEDFILNIASVAQVENIFATLGTRFAELIKRGH